MAGMEITVQVFNSFDEIKTILENQGFKMVETFQLNDWYFSKIDNIDGLKFIDIINNSLLVRQIITDVEKVQICYKKKQLDELGNVIAEEKITANTDSLQHTIDIFVASGLNNYCVVKNSSYVYKKDKICFAIQVIDNLGIFLEYEEDDSMINMDEKQKFNYMCRIVNSLNLKIGNDYFCKKMFMLLNKQKGWN